MVEPENAEGALFPMRAGERLRAARVKAGLDLGDVAMRTRVQQRHLEAIEAGDYAALPSITYAIGFAKSYARAVDEDVEGVARILREELGQRQPEERGASRDFEDADPSRIPSRTLAWTAAAILVAFVIAYGVWRNWLMTVPDGPVGAPQVATARARPQGPPPRVVNPGGEVVLIAREPVWLRIYDAKDKVLFEKEMSAGERFAVPRDADSPMIRTGRANLLAVTVDGREVAALGPAERTIKDVAISAAALAARVPEAPSVAGANASAANPGAEP